MVKHRNGYIYRHFLTDLILPSGQQFCFDAASSNSDVAVPWQSEDGSLTCFLDASRSLRWRFSGTFRQATIQTGPFSKHTDEWLSSAPSKLKTTIFILSFSPNNEKYKICKSNCYIFIFWFHVLFNFSSSRWASRRKVQNNYVLGFFNSMLTIFF